MGEAAYFNGTIGNYEEMTIPFSDRSVFYGDAVYDAVLFVYEIDGQSVGGKTPALRQQLQALFAEKIRADTGVRI